jgi:beta-lactam-binding protein with PASTA domain
MNTSNYFQILTPAGLGPLQLEEGARSEVQYTLKNISGIKRDAKIILVSIPPSPNGPVEKGWVKLDGPAQRSFEVGKSEPCVVKVALPPKATPGAYSFRLDLALADMPDEGDRGQAVELKVVPHIGGGKEGGGRWWIWVVAAAVLVFAGVALWLLLPSKIAVPDLSTKKPDDAKTALQAVGLDLSPTYRSTDTTDQSRVGLTLAQDPQAGTKVGKGTVVSISLGALTTVVPDLGGKDIGTARVLLQSRGLLVHEPPQTVPRPPNSAGGFVVTQNPSPETPVKTNTEVSLTVTELAVQVPTLTNLTYAQAMAAVSGARLNPVGQYSSGNTSGVVQSQNPAPNTFVNVGTTVTFRMPSAPVLIWPYRSVLTFNGHSYQMSH